MEFFRPDEFWCKCGRPPGLGPGLCEAPRAALPLLLEKLDHTRRAFGKPMVIASGARCAYWNKVQGGAPNSGHLRAGEVDIVCPSPRDRFWLVSSALQAGIHRIGIGRTFVHLGVSSDLVPNVIWTYYPIP